MNDEIYVLSLEEYDGIPEPGTEECIEITFSTGEQILAQGHVKFIAGYLEFDEYGGAGDGIQDSIEYDADEILKALNKLIIDINNKFINEKIKYIYFSGLIKNDYNS